jgi:hypothetical protein
MEACLDTNAPLAANPAPAWALSVARPVRVKLRGELRGVPRPALQTIFGKSLGRRIWQQARAKVASEGTPHADRVADAEISTGMVVYLSWQTSKALVESGRQAKGLSMTITYTDGEASLARSPMAHPTSEAGEIADAAIALLRRLPLRDAALASIRLAVTTVESPRIAPTTLPESTQNFGYSMPQPPARA